MKKIKCICLWLAILLLTGCSLAQPERADELENPDRFAGVFVVFGQRNLDRTNWVEYGTGMDVDTEFGKFTLPNEVLFAEYNQETWEWEFPGVTGRCAFVTDGDDGPSCTRGIENISIGYNDQDCTSLKGAVYIEESEDDYYVTYYNVFGTSDGRFYIDGTGNSMSSPAISGGGMGTTHEITKRENGEVVDTYSLEVHIDIQPVVPTKAMTLVEYDAENQELRREFLTLEGETIIIGKDTAWVLVEETDKEGNLHRSAYEPAQSDDKWVAHPFYLLQEDGSIRTESVSFEYEV